MDPILVKLMESGPVTFLLASAADAGKTPLAAGAGVAALAAAATLPATVLATARDADADILTILAPGVERIEYLRPLQGITAGQAPLVSVLKPKTSTTTASATAGLAASARCPPVIRPDTDPAGD